MEKFKYQIVKFTDYTPLARITERLNTLGNEGWELVGISSNAINDKLYVFKRQTYEITQNLK